MMHNPQKPEIELYTEERAAWTGRQAFQVYTDFPLPHRGTDSTPVLGSQVPGRCIRPA